MRLLLLILFLSSGLCAQVMPGDRAKYRKTYDGYRYVSIGSSSAKKPHTDKLTINGIVTAGIVKKWLDLSINYEYVNITPKYHSYFMQVQFIPIRVVKYFEVLVGGKYGRVIRDGGVYFYSGVNGEIRAGKTLYFSLAGSYDFRGDIYTKWGSSYWVFTTHLKIGLKL